MSKKKKTAKKKTTKKKATKKKATKKTSKKKSTRKKGKGHTKPQPYKLEDGISQSMLMSFLGCRQRMQYQLDGWESVGTKDSLRFGSYVHWTLEHLYKAVSANVITRRTAVAYLETHLNPRWRKHNKSAGPKEMQGVEMDILQWSACFPHYVACYPEDFKKGKWVDVEGQFDVEWKGFRLRGMRDGITRINRKLWMLETKTKSRIDEGTLMEALTFDFQNLFYLLANVLELGKPIRGVLYNVIRKPNLKLGQKESMPAHAQRIDEHIEDNGWDHYFKRFEIIYDQADLDRFADELILKLQDFKAFVEGKLPCYRNEGDCVGRWNCEYIPFCSSGKPVGFSQTRVPHRELIEQNI